LKIGVITPTDQLTGTTPDDIKIVINLNENNHDDVLNARISQAEIENAILKNFLGSDLAELRMSQVILS
jgi:hypothetical protein